MRTIRLPITNAFLNKHQINFIDSGRLCGWESHTTLRDVMIIFHELCGQGVLVNLARELNSRLDNNNYAEVLDALKDIVRDYIDMDDEQAYNNAYGNPRKGGIT